MTGRMRKHNIERDGNGERGKESLCRENDIFKRYETYKNKKRKDNYKFNFYEGQQECKL